MKKFQVLAIAFSAFVGTATAQSLDDARKSIDAEQYEKAKSQLKSVLKSKPSDGRAAYLLGNVYMKQNQPDSARIYFQRGNSASEGAKLNLIGLGQIELDNNNVAGAESFFSQALKDIKKKDTEELVYVARAYMNADKPDYKKAISYLERARTANPNDAQVFLALGDAHYGNKSQNDAYAAYRTALQLNPNLIRAKVQQGVLLKGARAFTEAVKAYDAVLATNPDYGPVYRELAETYYLWGNNDPRKYQEYVKKALTYYEKYMSLTDYSLASRMRHADFLILAKDYTALEAEAQKMKELDKVNPRILRYLGFAAYENGNTDVAVSSLEEFISNPKSKVIALDHLYLGLAKTRKASPVGGTFDEALYNAGLADLKKAVEMDINITNDLNEVGRKAYDQKQFKQAAAIFELAVSNPNSKNYLIDNFYLGNSIYYDNNRKDVVKPDMEALAKADVAFGNVATGSPTTQDAYLFRARTNRMMEKDAEMATYYEQFLTTVMAKGPEEVEKNKAKMVEAYNNIGAHYANTDKAKAREYFNKTLSIDAANQYAQDALKSLR